MSEQLTLPVIMNNVRALLTSWQGSTNIKTTAFVIGSEWTGSIIKIAKGGTNASTAEGALTNFGATTLGKSWFKSANQTSIVFPRVNADNTISYLDAASYRSAIGAGTGGGTVTSVTGTANRITVATGTTTPVIDIGTDVVTLTGSQALSNKTGLISQWTNDAGYLTTIAGISAGGELAGTYVNPTLVNSAVIGKVLTGYVSGAGTVASTDTILEAIQKLNGNIAAISTNIVVGSTVISSGTTTRILYDNAGVVGEYTLTGTGTVVVMQDTPTLTTPVLGVATATTINKVTITAPATGSTLTIADGKTLTASNTITFTATDGSTLAIGAGGTLGTAAYTASTAYLQLAGISGGQIVYGGTGVTDALTLIGTTGNGTTTAAGINLKVGNNGGTLAATVLNSGSTIFGTATSLVGTEVLSVQINQNNATRLTISNTTAGTASQAAIYLQTSGSVGFDINHYSASFTTSGSAVAGSTRLQSNGSAGLSIGTGNSAPLIMRIGAAEAFRLDTTSNFSNTTTTASTGFINLKASTTTYAHLHLTAGAAPSSPTDGQIWYDGANLNIRVGATTKTFNLT